MNKVRIITKVERTLCNNLNGLLRVGINTLKLPKGIQWDEVVCREHASLSTTEKVDDKVPVFSSTLPSAPGDGKTAFSGDERTRQSARKAIG